MIVENTPGTPIERRRRDMMRPVETIDLLHTSFFPRHPVRAEPVEERMSTTVKRAFDKLRANGRDCCKRSNMPRLRRSFVLMAFSFYKNLTPSGLKPPTVSHHLVIDRSTILAFHEAQPVLFFNLSKRAVLNQFFNRELHAFPQRLIG